MEVDVEYGWRWSGVSVRVDVRVGVGCMFVCWYACGVLGEGQMYVWMCACEGVFAHVRG